MTPTFRAEAYTFLVTQLPRERRRPMTKSIYFGVLLVALGLARAHAAELDLAASKITVHVEKSGLFSAFAHNHIISAPLASANLDADNRTVELKFRAQDMTVLDPGTSDSERSTIESTMKSGEVLDPARFPEITFASTSVEASAGDASAPTHYLVHGKLTLHGVTRPIDLSVSFSGGHYTGKVTLKQTDFGITPVKIAGGTIRVKDPIEIVFEIVPSK
jgi:polyisoprenoid-binding protein YceI